MQQKRIERAAYIIISGILLTLCMVTAASSMERGEVRFHRQDRTYRVDVEIARTTQERAFGLMEREQLDEDAGMLFVYAEEQPKAGSFWMYRTRIPLDIAFLGSDGEIRAIRTMMPCKSEQPSQCRVYTAGVPYHAALEVKAGYFEARGIEVGDTLELPLRD